MKIVEIEPVAVDVPLREPVKRVRGVTAVHAKAAVEMALVDLTARALGVSASTLLGGRVRDEVTLNAWSAPSRPRSGSAEALPGHGRGRRWRRGEPGDDQQDQRHLEHETVRSG